MQIPSFLRNPPPPPFKISFRAFMAFTVVWTGVIIVAILAANAIYGR